MSSLKLYTRNGSFLVAIVPPVSWLNLFGPNRARDGNSAHSMNQTNDNELIGNSRREADLGHYPPPFPRLLWIGLGVALHIKGLLRSPPLQRTLPVHPHKIPIQFMPDSRPQPGIVGLKDRKFHVP